MAFKSQDSFQFGPDPFPTGDLKWFWGAAIHWANLFDQFIDLVSVVHSDAASPAKGSIEQDTGKYPQIEYTEEPPADVKGSQFSEEKQPGLSPLKNSISVLLQYCIFSWPIIPWPIS